MKLINKALAGHSLAIAAGVTVKVDEHGEVEVDDEAHAKTLTEVGFKATFTKREAPKVELVEAEPETVEAEADEPVEAVADEAPADTKTTSRRRRGK